MKKRQSWPATWAEIEAAMPYCSETSEDSLDEVLRHLQSFTFADKAEFLRYVCTRLRSLKPEDNERVTALLNTR